MLELFRRNQIIYYLFVVLYMGVLSIPGFLFINSFSPPPADGLLYNACMTMIGQNHTIAILLYIVLGLLQIVLINSIVGGNRMSATNSLFPGIIYILLMQLIPELRFINAYFLANTFLFLAIFNFYQAERRKHRLPKIFNTFMYVGIASFFVPSYLLFALPLVLSVEIFLNFKWKDLWVLLFGGITPFYIIGSVYYLIDKEQIFLDYLNEYQFFGSSFDFINTSLSFVKLGLYAVLILIVLGLKSDLDQIIHIQARRKMTVMYVLLISSVIIFAVSENKGIGAIAMVVPFLASLVACTLLIIKNRRFAEIFHVLFIGLWAIFNFVV